MTPDLIAYVASSVLGGLFLASEALGLTSRVEPSSVTGVIIAALRVVFGSKQPQHAPHDGLLTHTPLADQIEAAVESLGSSVRAAHSNTTPPLPVSTPPSEPADTPRADGPHRV